jgi:hypothetical protein
MKGDATAGLMYGGASATDQAMLQELLVADVSAGLLAVHHSPAAALTVFLVYLISPVSVFLFRHGAVHGQRLTTCCLLGANCKTCTAEAQQDVSSSLIRLTYAS